MEEEKRGKRRRPQGGGIRGTEGGTKNLCLERHLLQRARLRIVSGAGGRSAGNGTVRREWGSFFFFENSRKDTVR